MSAGQTIILTGLSSRQKAENIVNAAPSGYVLIIKPPTRSNAQNDKMHAMLSDIARAKPGGRVMDKDKWKSVFLDALGKKSDWVPSLDGESVVCTGYRSSRLTKSEMSEMIELMYSFGAEQGVEWSHD